MKKYAAFIIFFFQSLWLLLSGQTPASFTYIYDDLNRLTEVQYGNGTTIVYAYDKVGNRTQRIINAVNPHQPDITPTNGALSLNTVGIGGEVTLTYNNENIGTGSTGGFTTLLVLSDNTTYEPGADAVLTTLYTPNLSAGAMPVVSEMLDIPADANAGNKYILILADYDDDVPNELSEANNTLNVPITLMDCGGLSVSVTPVDETCEDGNGAASASASGGSGPYQYSWSTIPSQSGATASGLSAGNYAVSVIDLAGCSAESSFTISNTGQDPLAGFNYSAFGLTVTFNNTSAFGTGYTWAFGDGNTSNQENAMHTYAAPGTYTVCLGVSNTCGADQYCTTIFVSTAACEIPSGLTASSVTQTSAMVGWSSAAGASSYNIHYREVGATTWQPAANTASATYSLGGLTAGTSYEVQVESVCGGVNSGYSTSYYFSTAADGGSGSNSGQAVYEYTSDLRAHNIAETLDGHFLITSSNPIGTVLFLQKITSTGQIIWNKQFTGLSGVITRVAVLSDGNYLLAGIKNFNLAVLKLDPAGNVLWGKEFGNSDIHSVAGILENNAAQVVVTGLYLGAGRDAAFAIQMDLSGNVNWKKYYYRTGGDVNPRNAFLDPATQDILVTGNYKGDGSFGNEDILFLRFSSSTGTLLQNSWIGTVDDDIGEGVFMKGSAPYIVGSSFGMGPGRQFFLCRLTDFGALEFTKAYQPGTNNILYGGMYEYDVSPQLLLGGKMIYDGDWDGVLMKVYTDGALIAGKKIHFAGGPGEDAIKYLIPTSNQKLAAVGEVELSSGKDALYFAHVDESLYLDCLDSDFSVTPTSPSLNQGNGISSSGLIAPEQALAGLTTDIVFQPIAVCCNITANIAASAVSICEGEAVDFFSTSTGASAYSWRIGTDGTPFSTNANTSFTFTAPGEYTAYLNISDGGSCTDEASVVITVQEAPDFFVNTFDEQCRNANGYASLDVSTVNNPEVLWSTGATTPSISGLSAGNYSVQVTNSSGCAITQNFSISNTSVGFTVFAQVEDVSCFEAGDGSIALSANGAQGTLSYNWLNGASTSSISGLAGGTYEVTVSDGAGCDVVASFTVGEPQEVAIEVQVGHEGGAGAGDAWATAIPSGGTPPYAYYWSNGATTATTLGLSEGAFMVTVTDANGCSATAEAPVFVKIEEADGVQLFKKDFLGGSTDYVQVIDLAAGAYLEFGHGNINSGGGTANPYFTRESMADVWTEKTGLHYNVFSITNGQFFNDGISPTQLAFPVKEGGAMVADGYGNASEFVGEKLFLPVWSNRADVVIFNDNPNSVAASSAPQGIVGLLRTADKAPASSTGRTFAGVLDEDGDGVYEKVALFSSAAATQAHAAARLHSFGIEYDKILMLDGGGSTQMRAAGTDYVSSTRLIPQYIVVYSTPLPVPDCAALVSPLPGSTAVGVDADLSWNAVPNAAGYRLTVGTSSGGTDILDNVDVGNTTTYGLSVLPEYTVIYVSVTPYNAAGITPACQEVQFRTENLTCGTATNLTTAAITEETADVSWQGVAPALEFEVRYKPVDSTDWQTAMVTASNLSLSGLQPGVLYEWQVKITCENLESAWSEKAYFTTSSDQFFDYTRFIKTYKPAGQGIAGEKIVPYPDGNVLVVSRISNGFVLSKFDPDGYEIWSKEYIDNSTRVRKLALFSDGAILVVNEATGVNDYFKILKMDQDGGLLWVKQGGMGSIGGNVAVAIDNFDNIVVAHSQRISGNHQLILKKYGSDGQTIWVRNYGPGARYKLPEGIAVDNNNNYYLYGGFEYATVPTCWITKYDDNGMLTWHKIHFMDGDTDWVHDIDFDASGNIYFVGTVYDGSPYRVMYYGKSDPNGNVLWVKKLSSVAGLAIELRGNTLYIAGYTAWDVDNYAHKGILFRFDLSGALLGYNRYQHPDLSLSNSKSEFRDFFFENDTTMLIVGADQSSSAMVLIKADENFELLCNDYPFTISLANQQINPYSYPLYLDDQLTGNLSDITVTTSTQELEQSKVCVEGCEVYAAFAYDPATACAGNTMKLHFTGLNAQAYDWRIGLDGSTFSSSPSPSVSFDTPGNYEIYLIVSDGACQDTAHLAIIINDPPQVALMVADINCLQPPLGAISTTVSNGIPPYQYVWSNNATTPDLDNLAIGQYEVTVTDGNGCVASAGIEIGNLPLILASENPICPGTPVTLQVEDDPMYSLSIEDDDGYVQVPNAPSLQITGDLTIEMWLKPTLFGVRRNPLHKAYGGEYTITQWENGKITFYWGAAGGDATPYQSFLSAGYLVQNEWNHVALVRDMAQGKLRWYINGVFDREVDADFTAAIASTNDLIIGQGYQPDGYRGNIDEVRIWNTALDAATIAAWKDRTLTDAHPVFSNLAGYWQLDEGSGTAVNDRSGNGNHGTRINDPAWSADLPPIQNSDLIWSTGEIGESIVVSPMVTTAYSVDHLGVGGGCSDEFTVEVLMASAFYADNDGDGFGDAAQEVMACTPPSGYVADHTDCNDGDPSIHPGADEVCDWADNNCNGQINEGIMGCADTLFADLYSVFPTDQVLFTYQVVTPGNYEVHFGDGVVTPVTAFMGTLTHSFSHEGVYRVRLMRDGVVVENFHIQVRSCEWISFVSSTNGYRESNEDLCQVLEGGIAHIDPALTPQSYYWTTFANYNDFPASGDAATLEVRVKNPQSGGGISCFDTGLTLYGDKGNAWVNYMTNGCAQYASIGAGDTGLSGSSTDLGALAKNLSDWHTIKIVLQNGAISTYFDGVLQYSLPYTGEVGHVLGIRVNFKGSGSVDWVTLRDGLGELVYTEAFNHCNCDALSVVSQPTFSSAYNDEVTILYPRPIDRSTLNITNLRFMGDEAGQRTGSYSSRGNAVKFRPDYPFRAGEKIMISSLSNLQDTGQVNQPAFVWERLAETTNPTAATFIPKYSGITLPAEAMDYSLNFITADVNRDSLMDYIIRYHSAYGNPTKILVYQQQSDHTFAAPVVYTNSYSHSNLRGTPDLNNDGYPDLVLTHNVPSNAHIRLNNGDGTFSAPAYYTLSNYSNGVTFGDIDQDGDIDLVGISGISVLSSNTISILRNNGDGTFASQQLINTSAFGSGRQLADLDGDGDLDFVYSSNNSFGSTPSYRVYENNGGNFNVSSNASNPDRYAPNAIYDFDQDGILDIVSTATSINIVYGVGGLNYSPYNGIAVGTTQAQVLPGDLNGDGLLDLFANRLYDGSSWETLPFRTYLNQGNRTFQADTCLLPLGIQQALKLSDADGDGDVDAFYLTAEGELYIAENVDHYASLGLKVFLQGPYDPGSGLMSDHLRSSGLLPQEEPYRDLSFSLVDGRREKVHPGIFDTTGQNAIVDWVLVELRNASDPSEVLATRSALLQRDGDVVDIDGKSALAIPAESDISSAYIAVHHRNHLGVMTASAIPLHSDETIVDFTDVATPTFGVSAQASLGGGVLGLVSGDLDASGVIDAGDRSQAWNDRNVLGYELSDSDLSGVVDASDRSNAWNNRNKTAQIQQ